MSSPLDPVFDAPSPTGGENPHGLTGYLEVERLRKSKRILGAFVRGAGGRALTTGTLDLDARQHAFYGQVWTAGRLIPEAIAHGRPYWHLDNGWMAPGRGELDGYYRVTYCSPSPLFIPGTDPKRAIEGGIRLKPWREDGDFVLICQPGPNFGAAWGLRMQDWMTTIEARVRQVTRRPIRFRPKQTDRPLVQDLAGAWCIVTHSSNVAVDAVIEGYPAIVEASSPTAPLGNVGLHHIEQPVMGKGRGEWLSSLWWQQFTVQEMVTGFAWEALQRLVVPAAIAAGVKGASP